MQDIAPVLVTLFLCASVVVYLLTKMVLSHQREIAKIQSPHQPLVADNSELVGEVKELRKQVSDLRELMMDLALSSPSPSIQARVKEQEIKG